MWIVNVDVGGQRVARCYLGNASQPITVGRPPAKAGERPDVVVCDKSVSKVHVELQAGQRPAEDGALVIRDRSRFGTSVNGAKLPPGDVRLRPGDSVQLAPKALLLLEQLPLVLAVPRDHPQLDALQQAAQHAGATLVHAWARDVTHALCGGGDGGAAPTAWSGAVLAALHGTPITTPDWLLQLASQPVWPDALPVPPRPAALLLPAGCRAHPHAHASAQPAAPAPVSVPLPPDGEGAVGRSTLAGLSFGYSSSWQDPGLEACVLGAGGRVLAARGARGAADGPVVEVLDGSGGGGGGAQGAATVAAGELLACILRSDAAPLRQLLSAAAGAQNRSATDARQLQRSQQQQQQPAEVEVEEIEDSDVTQLDEDGEEAEAGQEVDMQQAQGGAPQQPAPASAPAAAAAAGAPRATAPAPAAAVAGGGAGKGAKAAGGAAVAPAVVQGWLSALGAKCPLAPADPQHAAAAPAATTPPPDAPAAKKRRVNSGAAQTSAAAAASAPGGAAAAATGPESTQAGVDAARARAQVRTATAAAAAAAAAAAGVELPWVSTQHPASPPGKRRARAATQQQLPPAKVKPERSPASAAPGPMQAVLGLAAGPAAAGGKRGRGAKAAAGGKARGGAAAAADDVFDLRPVQPQAAAEQEQVVDASAQEVLHVPLLSGAGGQLSPDGPAAAAAAAAAAGARGAAAAGDGGAGGPNFKRFRRRDGAEGGRPVPVPAVEPVPVVVVDCFTISEHTEAFNRQEQERMARKRRADDMFHGGGGGAAAGGRGGSRKPPRAPNRR